MTTIELTSGFALLNTKRNQVCMPVFNSKMQWQISFTVNVEQKDHSTNWKEVLEQFENKNFKTGMHHH